MRIERFGHNEIPPDEQAAVRSAVRLEWVTLAYLCTTIALVYLVMGSSQAMKVAWIEDLLSTVPAISFLIALRRTSRRPTVEHPYGLHRSIGSAHLAAAVALLTVGVFLVYDSATGLLAAEHPPLGTMTLLGHTLWSGWVMIAVMVYAGIGPVILGRLKMPLSKQLHDKVLFADSDMQKADWMTAAAAIVGILGIGIGWWWADATAALVISGSILHDGVAQIRHALRGLTDGRARTHDDAEVHPLVDRCVAELQRLSWVEDAGVRVRDMGHVFHVEAFVVPSGDGVDLQRLVHARERLVSLDWKLQDVVVVPVQQVPEEARQT